MTTDTTPETNKPTVAPVPDKESDKPAPSPQPEETKK
jgi:hypothetical protein